MATIFARFLSLPSPSIPFHRYSTSLSCRMSKKKGSGWMKRHVQDSFVKLAKQDGNVSRAVYKLQEIDKKHHIINRKAPQTILELGAAPGSWTSYVVDRLAPESTLIAVDLLPLDPVVLQKLQMRRGDIQSYILQGDLISHDIQSSLFGKNVSVVLSDMAVNTCGDRATDALRTMGLVDSAFQLACTTLADGGSFVCKYFSCADEQDLKKQAKERFGKVHIIKPQASRKQSVERYLVATAFNGD